MFENENFDKVSSNCNQLILFNKIIIMHFLSILLVDLHPVKKTLRCKECNEMSHFFIHLVKYLIFIFIGVTTSHCILYNTY
jgi:hypothetical protein